MFIMGCLVFIILPINAQSSYFSAPVTTPVSCDYYIHLSVNGVPADLNDEIAFFDPQGNICGLYQVEQQNETIIVHVYGDVGFTQLDEGALPNDELFIHLWDHSAAKEYAHDHLLVSSITPDSQFFSPGLIPPIWQAEKGFAIFVDTQPYYQVQELSPLVCTYIGQITLIDGPAMPGTEIGVFDPDGVLCGSFRIKTTGQYGMLHIYGDNPDTQIDEGANDGDILSFRIKNHQTQMEIDSQAFFTTPAGNTGSFISSENPPIWKNHIGYNLNLTQKDDTNQYPIAQTKTVNGLEDESMFILLTAIDPDHEPFFYEISIEPEHGQLILIDEEEGDCYFTPDPDFFGIDTFWFTAENTIGVTDTAKVTIQIEGINDPPIATSQAITIVEDHASFIFLSGTDPDSVIEMYEIVQPAKHGILMLMDNTTGLCRYMPDDHYTGHDAFYFIVQDESYRSEPELISITITPVNDVPQLISPTTIHLNEDETTCFTIVVNDPDNDPISYELLSQPEHGQLTGQLPFMTYTPITNYFGNDHFSLLISDQTESITKVFDINILPINDPPLANAISPYTVYEGQPVTLDASQSSDIETINLRHTWTLPDFPGIALDSPFAITPTLTPPELALPQTIFLTLTVTDDGGLSDTSTVELFVIPAHTIYVQAGDYGQITPSGDIQVYHGESVALTVLPDPDYRVHQFILDYIFQPLSDNRFELNNITTDHDIFVTFARANQTPIAENQQIQIPLNESIQFQLSASDPDMDTLDIILDTYLLKGQLDIEGLTAKYTPPADFYDRDSFLYKVSDGKLESNVATVDIFVGIPIVDTIVLEDTRLDIAIPEDAIVITSPQIGTFQKSIYTPNTNANGLDQFEYELDGMIYTFKIFIKPVNDPPQLLSPTIIELSEDESANFSIMVNDPDDDPLSYELLSQPEHGQLTGQLPSMTYVPVSNYFGNDHFSLLISDQTESITKVFDINILPVNDPPTAIAITPLTAYEGIPLLLDASQSSDIESQDLSCNWILPDFPGIALDNPAAITPHLTPPKLALPQTILLTITVTDDGGLSDTSTVELFVIPSHTIYVQAGDNGQITPSGDIQVYHGKSITLEILPDLDYRVHQFILDYISQPLSDNRFELNNIKEDHDIFVTFARANQAPIAENQHIQIQLNESIQFQLLASDPDMDSLDIILDTYLLKGQLSIEGLTVTYTPPADFYDRDAFVYKVSDGKLESNMATVDIFVGIPIVDAIVLEDNNIEIPIPVGANIVSLPHFGNIAGSIYTPNLNAYGLDQFQYELEDTIYIFKIYIKPINDPPQLLSPTIIELSEDESANFSIIVNDPDDDPISYELLSQPEHGHLTGQLPSMTYIPISNYFGDDRFAILISDHTESITKVFEIDISPLNDPPTAIAISPLTAYDNNLIHLDASQSSDVESQDLTYNWTLPNLPGISLDNPSAITPTLTPPELATPQTIFLTLTVTDVGGLSDTTMLTIWIIPKHTIFVLFGENGQITPSGDLSIAHGGFIAFDIVPDFDYLVDQFFLDSVPQIVIDNRFELNHITSDHDIFVSFRPANRGPVAENQSIQTAQNASVNFYLAVSDPDNDPLHISWEMSSFKGHLILDDLSATYLPPNDFIGKDSLIYHAFDGRKECTATVDFFVGLPIVDAIVNEDTTQRLILPTKASILTDPQKGILNNFASDIYFVPDPNANGLDQFQYELNQEVFDYLIYIKAINDAPTAKTAAFYTVTERRELILDASQSYDIDNDVLTYFWIIPDHSISISDPFAVTSIIIAPDVENAGMQIPITLTVSDPEGLVSQSNAIIIVQDMTDPVASFEIENGSGIVPLNVKFLDTSIFPETWLWDFGDGSTSITQNPMHVYRSAGTYSVTLTVMNSGGSNQYSQKACIHVALEPLSVDFSSSGQQGVIPYYVTFYPDIKGEIENWQWDFGDGTISYDFQPTHVYQTIGQYTVTLSASRLTETVQQSYANFIQTSGHRISGWVQSADLGLGIANCRIDVSLMDEYIASVLTDPQGFYTINNLKPSSRYILSAWPPDSNYVYQFYNQKKYAYEATYVATGIPDQRIVFSMQSAPRAWISGTVTNGETPLSNVQVDLFSEMLGVSRSQTTQSNGTYTFTGLEESSDYRVSVYALDKQFFFAMQDGGIVGVDHPTQSVFVASQATPITLTVSGVRNIDIIVNPIQGAYISGTVRSDMGEIMPQVQVNAWSDLLNVGGSAISDNSGRYTITGLKTVLSENAPQKGYIVVIPPSNYMYQIYSHVIDQAKATRVSTGRSDIDFKLITLGSISGSVLTTLGDPVLGANIQAWSLSDPTGQSYTTLSHREGKFTLDLPVASDYIVSMKTESSAIQYYNQQTCPDMAELINLQHGDVSNLEFIIDKGPVIQGYVYDEIFGQASTSSTVVIESKTLGTIQTIETDSAGFFQFFGLDINISDYIISVVTEGYLPAYYADNMDGRPDNDTVFDTLLADGVVADDESTATDRFLTVKQGLTITGRVIDDQGLSVADAIIQFKSNQGIWKTTTDNTQDINFSITGILPGTYDFSVSAKTYLAYQDLLFITDDQILSIPMTPEPRMSIHGNVDQLEKGTQIDLIVWSETRNIYHVQTLAGTGDSIAYSVNNLPPAADYIVFVQSEEYADQYYPDTNRQDDAAFIDLSTRDVYQIDFVLTRNLSHISGQLTLEQTPSSETIVRIEARSTSTGGYGFTQFQLSSSLQEDYTITGLLPATDYIVYLQSTAYQNSYWDESEAGTRSIDLAKPVATPGRADFMLDNGFRIAGTITNNDGAFMRVQVEIWSQSTQTQKVTQTNMYGQYVVDGLFEADDYRIKVTTNKNGMYYYNRLGAVRQLSRSQSLSTRDDDLENIDMVLVTGDHLAGVIQTHTGQRIEGAWVSAWSDSQKVGGGAFSDENGSYIISDLPQWHDYVVTVEPSWNMPYETAQQMLITVPSENTNFILRHKQGVSISGIIRDPSGKPVHKAIVKMKYVNHNKRPAWTITDRKGQYVINLLTPNQSYKLEITPPKNKDWAIETREIYLNNDHVADVMLSSGYTVSGKIVDNLESAVDHALISIWSQSKKFAGETTSKANGKFEIVHVPMASDYVITVKAKGYLDKKETDQTPIRNMQIQMDSSGHISGIVRSLITGKPIENASIEIYSQANRALADYKGVVNTDNQGKFSITGLKPLDRMGNLITDFVVTAYANGFPPMAQTGKKPGDTVVFNLTKSVNNQLSGQVINADGQMVVIDIFSVNHSFVKTVMVDKKDEFTIDGLKPNQGYLLRFVALTFTGSMHEEWSGENDLGTLEQNCAKTYTTPDKLAFEFTFLNSPQKRNHQQISGPGPVQNLRSISHEHYPKTNRKRNVNTASNLPSNNPNVVVTWDPPTEDRENVVGYYSQFDTEESQNINKFNIPSQPPIRTRKITSRDLAGDDVQYYFHVAAVDKAGRVGETSSIAFRIDTIPPTNVQVIAPEISSTRNISLMLGATGASEMYISNLGYQEGGEWENLSNNKSWQLTEGSGTKNIYARFRDQAGNATQAAEITLFQPPLPTYIIYASSDFHGTITPSGSIAVFQGDNLTFTVQPEDQYTIAQFLVDNRIKTITHNTFVLTDIQKPHQIHVSFKQKNFRPIAISKTIYGKEDEAIDFELTGSDQNDDDDALTFHIVQQPDTGDIRTISSNQFIYQPAINHFGLFYLKFTASDNQLVSEPGMITFIVDAVNDPPQAEGQSVETKINTPVEILLHATDVDNNKLIFSVVKHSSNGTVLIQGQKALFTPDAGFNDPTEFTFKAYDGKLFSNVARVEIWVGLPPVDTVLTEDTPQALTIPANAIMLTLPVKGIYSNGIYTPTENASGNDLICFQIDGIIQSHSLFIKPVNDPPQITTENITLKEDQSIDILLTATDIEDDPITLSIDKAPHNGALKQNLPVITYTPDQNFNGTDEMVIQASDGMDSITKTLNITIQGVNDPPVAQDESISKMPIVIPVSFTLKATDIDRQDTLSYTIVSQPQTGILSGADAVWTYTQEHWGKYEFQFIASDGQAMSNTGTVTLYLGMPVVDAFTLEDTVLDIYDYLSRITNNNKINLSKLPAHGRMLGSTEKGIWGYRPNKNYYGTEEFSFIVGQDPTQYYFKLYVYPVNDPPKITIPARITTNEDCIKSFTYQISDVDSPSETWKVEMVAPENGRITQTSQIIVYQPNNNFNGNDMMEIVVSDEESTNSSIVQIQVIPVNDPPEAISQEIRMLEDSRQTIILQGTDIESTHLTYQCLTEPLHGQIIGNLPNIVYTPEPDSLLSDSFQFTVSDGELTSLPATVTIEIQNVNDPPQANGMQFNIDHPGNFTGTLDASDIDPDILIYSIVDYPRLGEVIISNSVTGEFIYYAPEVIGEDYFSFKVHDGTMDSNTATVLININTPSEQKHPLTISLTPPYQPGDPYRYVLLDTHTGKAVRDNVCNTATVETSLPENRSYRLFILSSTYCHYTYPEMVMPSEIPIKITLTPLSEDRQVFETPDISQTNVDNGFYLNITSNDLTFENISVIAPINPEADSFMEITPTSEKNKRKIYKWQMQTNQYSAMHAADSGLIFYTINVKLHGETQDYTFSVNYVTSKNHEKETHKSPMHKKFENAYGPTQTQTISHKIFYPMEGTTIRLNIKDHNETLPVIIPPIPIDYLFIDKNNNLNYDSETDMYDIFCPKMILDTETPLMAKVNYYTFDKDVPGSAVEVTFFVASGQYEGYFVRYNPIVNNSEKRYDEVINQKAPSIVIPLILNHTFPNYSTIYQELIENQKLSLYIDEKGDGENGFKEYQLLSTLMNDHLDVVLLSMDHLTGIGFAHIKESVAASDKVDSDSGGCFIKVLEFRINFLQNDLEKINEFIKETPNSSKTILF